MSKVNMFEMEKRRKKYKSNFHDSHVVVRVVLNQFYTFHNLRKREKEKEKRE